MARKVWLLIKLSQPGLLLLLSLLALAGASLSPHFLSPEFPGTRLSQLIGGGALAPRVWSLIHAVGGAVITGLLWSGTALIHEIVESGADRVDHPEQAVPSRAMRPSEMLRWALGLQTAGFLLVLVAGTRSAMLLALLGAGLGNAYSLPPLRLAKAGPVRYGVVGGGAALAIAGGMMGQGGASEVGMLTALALGLLASATSMIIDFREPMADGPGSARSLPGLLGRRTALGVYIGAVLSSYLVVIFLLMHTIGMQRLVLGSLLGLMALHTGLLTGLYRTGAHAYGQTVYRWSLIIYVGVAALYVGAQALY